MPKVIAQFGDPGPEASGHFVICHARATTELSVVEQLEEKLATSPCAASWVRAKNRIEVTWIEVMVQEGDDLEVVATSEASKFHDGELFQPLAFEFL